MSGIRAPHLSIVTETYRPEINGVAHTLARLTDRLRESGYRVSIVRPRQRADGSVVPHDESLVRGLPVPGYAGVQVGLAWPRAIVRVWRADPPDAVYVATEGPLGSAAVTAARRLGIRVLSGFHTNFHSYSRHYGLGRLQPFVARWLAAFHRRTDGTFVASADIRDALRREGVARVHVLGRGVDAALFTPERRCRLLRATWGAVDEDVVAIYVGRMAAEKNLPLAIDAFRAIQAVAPTARFVLVGDGPARIALERQHPDLMFVGVRTGDDLARHYASADLFLFPSETDTFGNVTLEAMASGLAVVAFDYAAAHQHITHGHDGLLAPLGDAAAFVRLASRAARQPDELAIVGARARAHALTLEWDDIAARFAAVLLDDPRGGARPQTVAPRHAVPRMEDAT